MTVLGAGTRPKCKGHLYLSTTQPQPIENRDGCQGMNQWLLTRCRCPTGGRVGHTVWIGGRGTGRVRGRGQSGWCANSQRFSEQCQVYINEPLISGMFHFLCLDCGLKVQRVRLGMSGVTMSSF